jgi:hypothetical protein
MPLEANCLLVHFMLSGYPGLAVIITTLYPAILDRLTKSIISGMGVPSVFMRVSSMSNITASTILKK